MISESLWQALPPRKKSRRGAGGAAGGAAGGGEGGGEGGGGDGAGGDRGGGGSDEQGGVSSGKKQQIQDAVAARSSAKNMSATLEGKDGCAGEFYEYLGACPWCACLPAWLAATLISPSPFSLSPPRPHRPHGRRAVPHLGPDARGGF